jgi:hypothetical protein
VRFICLAIALTGVLLFECFFNSLTSLGVHSRRTDRLFPLTIVQLLLFLPSSFTTISPGVNGEWDFVSMLSAEPRASPGCERRRPRQVVGQRDSGPQGRVHPLHRHSSEIAAHTSKGADPERAKRILEKGKSACPVTASLSVPVRLESEIVVESA